nr:hypothetical protein [Tanacetum cinerariifolium]
QEPQRTSPRFTQKPPIQHKKPTIPVNSFSQSKPTTEARKPIPNRHSLNSNPFSSKSVQARRAAEYNRNLYVDISQFVDCSSKSVKTKPQQAKRVVNTSGNARKNTKEEVARIVTIWKPTGRRFNLCDFYGTQKYTEHILKPSELTPCVSPSTNATLNMKLTLDPLELSPSVSSSPSSTITIVSWFSDHSLSDRKASPLVHLFPSALHNILWSKGRIIADSDAETFKDQAYSILNL